jgi:hypothetical protein
MGQRANRRKGSFERLMMKPTRAAIAGFDGIRTVFDQGIKRDIGARARNASERRPAGLNRSYDKHG